MGLRIDRWKVRTGMALIAASLVLGAIQYALFHNARDLFFYLFLDVVFVPVQVLLVTLIIERFLALREKEAMLTKLNMVIGAFYSEVGNELLRRMLPLCSDRARLEAELRIDAGWGAETFRRAGTAMVATPPAVHYDAAQFADLQAWLRSQRPFLLGLLQNPNLLEHEMFTDLLLAIGHLSEELDARHDFAALPPSDSAHLCGDLQRVAGLLLREWLTYLHHQQRHYPYIFSLALRTNPFTPERGVEVM